MIRSRTRPSLWSVIALGLAGCEPQSVPQNPAPDTADTLVPEGTTTDTDSEQDTAEVTSVDESCTGPWIDEMGDAFVIPDIPGTPVLVEGFEIPYLHFDKDESRPYCVRVTPDPKRVVVKIEFSANELHNHIGCAGLLLTATPRTGKYAGDTIYSQDPESLTFYRSTKIRVRDDRIEDGIWDLVLTDKSILDDHNEDGQVTTEPLSQGGDQCTMFDLGLLIYYE